MHFGLPDTSHPGTRGIDKAFGGKFKWVWLNPFKCLWYMRSPNLLALVSRFRKRPSVMQCVTPILSERRTPDVRRSYCSVVRIWYVAFNGMELRRHPDR
jgi:hypothetical protein